MTGTTRTAGGRRTVRAPNAPTCLRGHRKVRQPGGALVCRVCQRQQRRKRWERHRQQRLKARRTRIRNRNRPPVRDRIWAAGLFEGEGTFSLTAQRGTTVSRPWVAVASTDRSVVDFFQTRWPGHVTWRRPLLEGRPHRDIATWRIFTCERVEGFILDLRPYLRTERMREKAELLLEDIRDRVHLRRTPAERQRKRVRMAKMRALNRRGVQLEGEG